MNQDKAFFEQICHNPPTSKADWLAYVREAARSYHDSPLRGDIALELAGNALTHFTTTEAEEIELQPIKDALYELELPDSHIAPRYMDDYNLEEATAYAAFANAYVSYKWRKLADRLATDHQIVVW